MSSVGVGISVAFGVGMGSVLADPGLVFPQVLFLMIFNGLLAGFVFHFYQVALKGVRLPFNRR